MILLRATATLFCLQFALAGLCSSTSLIPFSGYKVTRRYKIRIRPLKSEGYLVLTKCHRGIPLFSRTIGTSSSHDEFAMPFCPENTDFDFSGRQRAKQNEPGNLDSFPNAWATEGSYTSTSGLLANRFSRSARSRKSGLMSWIPPLFGKPITDSKDNKVQGSGDHPASIQLKEEHPPTRAPCMKMARRKQYARSDVVIFIPATFVGVLFACSATDSKEEDPNMEVSTMELGAFEGRRRSQLSESRAETGKTITNKKNKKQSRDQKKKTTNSYTFLDQLTGEEDSFTGSPVCPLVADDYSAHWVSVQLSPLALIYHVPYLRSPSLWDPRFKSAQWDEDVDINESYNYSKSEATKISKALIASSRYMTRLFSSKRAKASRILAFKKHWLKKFDPRLQLSLHLISMGKPVALRHVVRLQRLWDGLFKAPKVT